MNCMPDDSFEVIGTGLATSAAGSPFACILNSNMIVFTKELLLVLRHSIATMQSRCPRMGDPSSWCVSNDNICVVTVAYQCADSQ
jgi:hypothetical protein